MVSQRSLHNAPIFRLLLKVAVNGTHQCDFLNFCGALGPQHQETIMNLRIHERRWSQTTGTHIHAEGAIALSVTLSGGALFAN